MKDILDLAEDVPYNVQALSSVAWELLGDEDGHVLTPKLVRRALNLLVERDGPFYLTVWNGLTTVQQRVLAAAIHEGGVAMTSASSDAETPAHAQHDEQDPQIPGGPANPTA